MDGKSEKNQPPKTQSETLTLTPNSSSSKTPSSSSSSLAGPTTGSSSYYYPGCRKDANCKCDICLASIHATRDLISGTHLSSKKRSQPFIRFNPSASPQTGSRSKSRSGSGSTVTAPATPPLLKSTAKTRPLEKAKKEEQKGEKPRVLDYRVLGYRILSLVLLWLVFWVVDSGFVMRGFGLTPKLKMEEVERIGEESRGINGDLNQKIRVFQKGIGRLVGDERVHDCGAHDSVWEMNQRGQEFFHWRCVVYKSTGEEVSIWGSPLTTSGLFSTGLSSRSLTLLSGKLTEWSDGKLTSSLRASNCSSWHYGKWSYSAIQLEPNTWILEYKRSGIVQGPRFIPEICDLVRFKIANYVKRLRREPWRLFVFRRVEEVKIVHPT
ncbi:hypothetical protein LUZ60_006657 [Juncus effusus]|nr:hypothetical protein LUZ60_006657 [Juncus effusus]